MTTTRIRRRIHAPRAEVFRLLLDRDAIPKWRVPAGMSCIVHSLDPREGGTFRVSLTYESRAESGKTTSHTDTYHGHFAEIVENEKVVEVIEFETVDPALQGAMTITTVLSDAADGTELVAVHEHLPPGLSPADNEIGWQQSLGKLAALAATEGRRSGDQGSRR